MSEVYLSALSKSNADWLSARQTLIASNVANSSTPGFKAQDVKPFEEANKNQFTRLLVTNATHLQGGLGNVDGVASGNDGAWETVHSGGNVNLAREAIKSGDVAAGFELNTSVLRSFNRMVASVWGA
ncbi:MAG: flagellar basal body protein [Nitratireductor sp.]